MSDFPRNPDAALSSAEAVLAPPDVLAAADRLAGIANPTPVLTSRTLNERVGHEVFLKAESFQRTGSFKFRGAYNHLAAIEPAERERGVVGVSSGNHAQGLALAASLFDIPAVILMPDDSPVSKRAATVGYGAEVIGFDRYSEDRDALADQLTADRGMRFVSPFDHPLTMAGQGTVALELISEVGTLDALVVCVGGGGLMAGCATIARHLNPNITIIGVEPATGDDTRRSLAAGERVTIDVPRTIADGLQIVSPGKQTFEVNRRLVDDVVTVSDDELVEAMRFAYERMNIVIEPSGAAALAAVLNGRVAGSGKRVGATITGGNVDLEVFADLLSSR